MEQSLLKCQQILKEVYEPLWNNRFSVEPTFLLQRIAQPKLTSNNITAGSPIGLSGGFGFGAEGTPTPIAGNLMYNNYKLTAKDMFVNICISDKAITLGKQPGAMGDIMANEVEASYDTAKWNVGRSIFGDGTGKLTKVKSGSGNKLYVDSHRLLKEGLIIDIYADDESIVSKENRIIDVSRAPEADGTYVVTLMTALASEATTGFITVQKSYNRELTGLGAIFNPEIEEIYGVNRVNNKYMYPEIIDAAGDVSNKIFTKALRQTKNYKNGDVDLIMCGEDTYDSYTEYLMTNNIRIENSDKTMEGGFKAIEFMFGPKKVEIVCEQFIPSDEAWGVSTKEIEFKNTGWGFAQAQGSGIFKLLDDQSTYRALLRCYGELICRNIGGFFKIKNCVNTSNI